MNVKRIGICTFITKNEIFNKEIDRLVLFLDEKGISTGVYVFADYYIDDLPKNYKLFVTPGVSKHKRLYSLIEKEKPSVIICLDSDVTVNLENVFKLLMDFQSGDYAIAWGRISVTESQGFIAKLITIDKILSHNIIRPILWNMNVGISVPGQIFILEREFFISKSLLADTVFDDLALGIIVRENKMPYLATNYILGTEMPKANISELMNQRCRWAQGYAEIFANSFIEGRMIYVLLHGVAYHFLIFLVWAFLLMLILKNVFYFSFLFVFVVFCLSWFDYKNIFSSILYLFVFPLVHIWWFICFICYLMRRMFVR